MNSSKLVGFELCYVSALSQVTGSRTDTLYLHHTETSITYTLRDSSPRIVWIRYPAVDSKATLSSIRPRLVMIGVLIILYDMIHPKILLTLTHSSIDSNKFYKSCQYKILLLYEESVWRPCLVINCCRNLCSILLQIYFVIEISPKVSCFSYFIVHCLFISHSTFHHYLFCLYQPNYVTINQLFCPSRFVIDVMNINS